MLGNKANKASLSSLSHLPNFLIHLHFLFSPPIPLDILFLCFSTSSSLFFFIPLVILIYDSISFDASFSSRFRSHFHSSHPSFNLIIPTTFHSLQWDGAWYQNHSYRVTTFTNKSVLTKSLWYDVSYKESWNAFAFCRKKLNLIFQGFALFTV